MRKDTYKGLFGEEITRNGPFEDPTSWRPFPVSVRGSDPEPVEVKEGWVRMSNNGTTDLRTGWGWKRTDTVARRVVGESIEYPHQEMSFGGAFLDPTVEGDQARSCFQARQARQDKVRPGRDGESEAERNSRERGCL